MFSAVRPVGVGQDPIVKLGTGTTWKTDASLLAIWIVRTKELTMPIQGRDNQRVAKNLLSYSIASGIPVALTIVKC